jgi:hypothetical protein
VSSYAGGDARVTEDDLKKSSTELWRGNGLFFAFRIPSQRSRIFVIPCAVAAARCLFQSASPNALMPAAVSPSPSVTFKPAVYPHVCFLSFFKGALLPYLNKLVERQHLIMWGQQLENIFSNIFFF